MTYTAKQLDKAALRDLLNDARCANLQALSGPFYPDRGITAQRLLAYAAKCRAEAAKYINGGAHNAVLEG